MQLSPVAYEALEILETSRKTYIHDGDLIRVVGKRLGLEPRRQREEVEAGLQELADLGLVIRQESDHRSSARTIIYSHGIRRDEHVARVRAALEVGPGGQLVVRPEQRARLSALA